MQTSLRLRAPGGDECEASLVRRSFGGFSASQEVSKGPSLPIRALLERTPRLTQQATVAVGDDQRWCAERDLFTQEDDHPGWF